MFEKISEGASKEKKLLESAICFDTRMQVKFASELISFFARQTQAF